jgi:hypothetical protein
MNKKTFCFGLVLFVFGSFFIQSIFAGEGDGYSGSQNSLQEFKRRFVEMKNDSEFRTVGDTSNYYPDFYF